jgi:hypothetical protein
MSKSTAKIEFIVGYTLFFVALWLLWDTPLVYPVKIFVVLLHEMSHAAVAVATGGHIDRIELSSLEGGACYCPGGNAFLTASAGYLGSSAWGGLMFTAARVRRVRAEWVTGFIGVLVVALSVLYVRTAFGLVFGVLFGLAMLGVARKATRSLNRTLLFALGLTSVLYAILDIKTDGSAHGGLGRSMDLARPRLQLLAPPRSVSRGLRRGCRAYPQHPYISWSEVADNPIGRVQKSDTCPAPALPFRMAAMGRLRPVWASAESLQKASVVDCGPWSPPAFSPKSNRKKEVILV